MADGQVTGQPGTRLVRLSQLARFWGKNPRTLQTWIRQGRLAAIRSPGNHIRLRVADVRGFCEREGWAVPPFVAPPPKRIVLATADTSLHRAMARALKAPGLSFEAYADGYQALLAAARGTALVAFPGASKQFDARGAIAALGRCDEAQRPIIVAYDVVRRMQAASLAQAGAARVVLRAQQRDLPRIVRELLGLE